MTRPTLLEATGIKKNYGAVQALRGVDLTLRKGETIALVGDNGAGKSTLVKILSGAVRPSSGTIKVNGNEVAISSTDVARSLGIETVYQDLGLCNNLNVAENIFLGREEIRRLGPFNFLNKKAMKDKAEAALSGLSINKPHANANVAGLSGGQRQAVAIARTKLWHSGIVLLDEPTAALGVQETKRAMDAVRQLQAEGVSIILITHNMPMVKEMSQRVVVLRQGTKVGDIPTSEASGDDIVSLITGARQQWIQAA
jgi:ABC-type sugar transport system ATPase subunit